MSEALKKTLKITLSSDQTDQLEYIKSVSGDVSTSHIIATSILLSYQLIQQAASGSTIVIESPNGKKQLLNFPFLKK